MRADAVSKVYGQIPTTKPSIDPLGNERWLAHLDCMHSAALRIAGDLDTTCVRCGQQVDADERRGPDDAVWKRLGVKPGRQDPLAGLRNAFEAATHAWQCQSCGRWLCNRCACAALIAREASRLEHEGCGGRFTVPGR